MLGYVVIGALAAFGLVSAVWILCGLVLPKTTGGVLLFFGEDAVAFARRYLWLREMGLLRCPLWVVEPDADAWQWLKDRNIEICSRETLVTRLGIGAEEN